MEYSAGLVSQSFWFPEIKKVIKLVLEGESISNIKTKCIYDNLFGAPNETRAKRMYGYIWSRINNLSKEMMKLFINSNVATQKIINLIAIIKNDKLFFDFLYEVYREKIILGVQTITESDLQIFMKNKEEQIEEVNNYKDVTKKRLTSAYINFMIDANLISIKDHNWVITPPILDINLEDYLKYNGEQLIIKALTGER